MSLSRAGEHGEYFDVRPGYVYVKDGDKLNGSIESVPQFCELAMRALAQSGELNDKQLEDCQEALEHRFNYVFDNE